MRAVIIPKAWLMRKHIWIFIPCAIVVTCLNSSVRSCSELSYILQPCKFDFESCHRKRHICCIWSNLTKWQGNAPCCGAAWQWQRLPLTAAHSWLFLWMAPTLCTFGGREVVASPGTATCCRPTLRRVHPPRGVANVTAFCVWADCCRSDRRS